MSGPLDHSVTLDDVFAIVNTKRVPLAPELAGYLTLEIAEGAQAHAGEVDPRSVYIGEEGTVALVRPKEVPGDTETSVRGILARLLEASGSQTPALGAAARRKSGTGLGALVEELEAALIPVNRAAGRRALARLAREVKRVTLGVGRNAPPPDRPAPRAPPAPPAAPPAPSSAPRVASSGKQRALAAAPPPREPTPRPPAASEDPFPDFDVVLPRAPSAPPAPAGDAIEANVKAHRSPSQAPPGVDDDREAIRELLSSPPTEGVPESDAVDQLLATFGVSGATTDRAVSRELKAMVGLEPTPPPPNAPKPGAPDDVEQLLALSDQSIPIANVHPPANPGPKQRAQGHPMTKNPDSPSGSQPAAQNPSQPSQPRTSASPQAAVPPAASSQPELPRPSGSTRLPPPSHPPAAGAPPRPTTSQPPHVAATPSTTPSAPQVAASPALTPSAPAVQVSVPMMAQGSAPVSSQTGLPVLAPLGSQPLMPAPTVSQSGRPAAGSAPPGAVSASQRVPAPGTPLAMPQRQGSRYAKTVVVPQKKKGPRVDRILAVATIAVLGIGAVAIWKMRPGLFGPATADNAPATRPAGASAAPTHTAPVAPVVRCRGTLNIVDVPTNAEVLMRVGQAPVDIDRMPVGARLEFVATAEGYAPKRSIVPAGSPWDPGPDGRPRFELAVQLDPSRAKIDPWPAGEPGSVVGGKGAPGTVHVVSTPRGAEMWLLVGTGPEALIDPIKCDVDAEILVAGPTTFRRRLRATSEQIEQAPIGQTGGHTVKLSAKNDASATGPNTQTPPR